MLVRPGRGPTEGSAERSEGRTGVGPRPGRGRGSEDVAGPEGVRRGVGVVRGDVLPLQLLVGLSIQLRAGVVRVRPTGELEYPGTRPEGRWHGHGYFLRRLKVIGEDGREGQVPQYKHRWLDADGGTDPRTQHSRPEDDLPSVRSSALVVVLALWRWLDSGGGLYAMEPCRCLGRADAAVADVVSERTLQRWMHRARSCAMDTHQAIREAIIAWCEPRPMEHLFEGGLSPPGHLNRRWRGDPSVSALWSAFAMALDSSVEFATPAHVLLAEARRRWTTDRTTRFLI